MVAEQDGVARARIAFHGDVRRANALFLAQVAAGRDGRPRARAAYALARLRTRPRVSLAPAATPWTNRAFLLVDRPAGA